MIEARKELRKKAGGKETDGKAKGKTKGKTRDRARTEAGNGKEEAQGEAGAERLQTAAAGRVGLDSKEIAKALVDKALEGHIGSFRLLLKLTEPKVLRNRPVKRRKPTMAMLLAADPPWPEDRPPEYGDNDMDGVPAYRSGQWWGGGSAR
ncbi:MAG TPA: hypothetical protein VGE83_05970 [Terracidiphilus sp.]|jgi:hypothetical protein